MKFLFVGIVFGQTYRELYATVDLAIKRYTEFKEIYNKDHQILCQVFINNQILYHYYKLNNFYEEIIIKMEETK